MVQTFLSHDDAAESNRNLVLQYIKIHGPVSRTDIWEAMDISRSSVTLIVKQLLDLSLILEVGEGLSRGGRKPQHLILNEHAAVIFVLNWFTATLYLSNWTGRIIDSQELAFPKNCPPGVFAATVTRACDEFSAKHRIDKNKLLGLGLSMPGLIDRHNKLLISSAELNWQNISLANLFSRHLAERVFVDRATNIMALGAYDPKTTTEKSRAMMILLSHSGIGCSFVENGICQYGSNHMIGEIGHMKFEKKILCSCGQTGCLEAIVLDRLLQNENMIDELIIDYLAKAIGSAANIIDPATLILTGDLLEDMDSESLRLLKSLIRQNVLNLDKRNLEIMIIENTAKMTVEGMSSYIFTSCFNTVVPLQQLAKGIKVCTRGLLENAK